MAVSEVKHNSGRGRQYGGSRGGQNRGGRSGQNSSRRGGTNTRKTNPRSAAKRAPRKAQSSAINSNYGWGTALVLLGILFFVLQLLSGLRWWHGTVKGLFGDFALIAVIQLIWMGVRAFRAANRDEEGPGWMWPPLLLGLCFLSAVQAFRVEKILAGLKIKDGYVNFLNHAFDDAGGGGLFGSILGYPLQRVLSAGGSLAVYIVAGLLILHFSGIVNLGKVFSGLGFALGKSGKYAGEKIGDLSSRAGEKIRQTREALAQRRQNEELLDEEIYSGEPDGPVRPIDLDSSRSRVRATRVEPAGDELEIPVVGKRSRTAKKPELVTEPDDDADIWDSGLFDTTDSGLMNEVRAEDPEKRNTRYSAEALRDHSREPKPKLNFRYGREDTAAARQGAESAARPAEPKPETRPEPKPMPKPESKPETGTETPQAAAPAKQPQQPKPSYFDTEEKPLVKQNTEQGRPSATTYVKPDPDRPATSAAASESGKAPAAPKPKAERPYAFPSMELMETSGPSFPSGSVNYDDEDRRRAETLVKTLENFNIKVKLTGVSRGPAVTRYEILPAPGIKVSRIAALADDIAMALAAVSVRVEAPIPGKSAVGVEVPNTRMEVVHLRDVLEAIDAKENGKKLMVGLGKDNSGKHIVANLASMPHVLIAGQTGSGKSVCINAFIISVLYRATPEEVRMIMIDPKMVELNVYNTIPHLLVPVVTDPKKAAGALEWAVAEMTRRYKVFAERKTKNIESYNAHLEPGEEKMPQILIIIDELADLMMTAPTDVEEAINRLAQLARAAGMHLVIATQRPSVNVITGVIKANIPTRIAFTVASGVDSRTILDSYGAEKLLGRGDMLYLPSDRNKPIRIQGAWVSEDEVQAVVDHVSNIGEPVYDEDMLQHLEDAGKSDAEKKDKRDEEAASDTDDLFEEALRSVVEAGQASISMLQRKLRVGYARAGRLIDEMAQRGYVSQSEGSKSREVLITREQLAQIFSKDE